MGEGWRGVQEGAGGGEDDLLDAAVEGFAGHLGVGQAMGDEDLAVGPIGEARGQGELLGIEGGKDLGDGGADLGAADVDGPADGGPGELGVSLLIGGDLRQGGAHGGVGAARPAGEGHQGGEGLADAAFACGGGGKGGEVAGEGERIAEGEALGPDRLPGVGAGELEAELGVPHLL